MNFQWDERKNQSNIQKHTLDFADAHWVFESPMLVNLTTAKITVKNVGLE